MRGSTDRRRRASGSGGRGFPRPVNARTAPLELGSYSSSDPLRHASIPPPAGPGRELRHAEKDLREAVIRIAVMSREGAEESQSGNHFAALHSWLSARLGIPAPLSTTLQRCIVGNFRSSTGGRSLGFVPHSPPSTPGSPPRNHLGNFLSEGRFALSAAWTGPRRVRVRLACVGGRACAITEASRSATSTEFET